MSGTVAVVTDSTAYLPSGVAEKAGIAVVPLQVVIGGRAFAEGADIGSAAVTSALLAGQSVTTSRATPHAFAEVYRGLGASAVVSLHLSGEVSGTVDAARTAAREVAADGIRVEVVDSRSLAMGLGYAVITAASLAAAGAPVEEVARRAAARALDSATFLYVDTLEHLRRGGRIGPARARLGSALSVKPVLHLVDGRLEPLDRVRTREKAIARLVEVSVAEAGDRPVDVAVHHLAARPRAREVADRLRDRLPHLREMYVGEVGAVVGAHVGPGMVGVVLSPTP